MPRIRVRSADGTNEVAFKERERLLVGRVEGCDIVLVDESCSRRHCEIVVGESAFRVRDLNSSNGTLLNGAKVNEAELKDGDEIRVGKVRMQFLMSDSDCEIGFVSGEKSGLAFPLSKERLTMGRRPENTVVFKEIQVSGLHLEIVREGDGYVLRDLGSTNGTLLDGRKVTEVTLSHGDRVRLGESEFVFTDRRRESQVEPPSAGAPPEKVALKIPRRGRMGALVSLTLLVGSMLGAGWYFFLGSGGEDSAGAARRVAPSPEGNLLAEDWSFENPAAVAGIWTSSHENGFNARRGGAQSGSYAFAADVADGAFADSIRKAIALTRVQPLTISGAWSVDEQAAVAIDVEFRSAPREAESVRSFRQTVLFSGSTQGQYVAFEASCHPPEWAGEVLLCLVASGSGTARVDDLCLELRGPVQRTHTIGEVTVVDRGGAFSIVHRSAVLEMLRPWGTMTTESATLELPPGAFQVTQQWQSTRLKVRIEGSNRPQALVALVGASFEEAPVTVFLEGGAEQHYGNFEVASARAVLVGNVAERAELVLDPPCGLSSVRTSLGKQIQLHVGSADSVEITVRGDFKAEQDEAVQLCIQAENDLRAGRLGDAMGRVKDIRLRLPYSKSALERAQKIESELARIVREQLDAFRKEAEAAEFLNSLERFEPVLKLGDQLLQRLGGSDLADAVRERVARMHEVADGIRRSRHESEASELLRLIEAYQEFDAEGRSATIEELRRALREHYSDTEAAGRLQDGRS